MGKGRKLDSDEIVNRLLRLKALAGEHFDDYVIIGNIRGPKEGGNHLVWVFSESSFALGSMSRVECAIHDRDASGPNQ